MKNSRNLTKSEWYNLYRSLRWAQTRMSFRESFAWITSHCSNSEVNLLMAAREW